MTSEDDERWAWVSKRQAARYRQIATLVSNPAIAERLRRIANEYEAESAAVRKPTPRGDASGDE